jgi:hypothetical protein
MPVGASLFLGWFLVVFGVTKIVTCSKIAAPLRFLYAPLFACPLCFAFWVGLGLTWLPGHIGPAGAFEWPLWLAAIANGFAASAAAWIVHVPLVALGESKL